MRTCGVVYPCVYQRYYGPVFICDVYLECVPDIFQINISLNLSVVSGSILTALVSCYETLVAVRVADFRAIIKWIQKRILPTIITLKLDYTLNTRSKSDSDQDCVLGF